MNANEIARTAYKFKPRTMVPYGLSCGEYRLSRDANTICPSCKHDEPEEIRDRVILAPFKAHYKSGNFRVYKCPFCTAQWSHATE